MDVLNGTKNANKQILFLILVQLVSVYSVLLALFGDLSACQFGKPAG